MNKNKKSTHHIPKGLTISTAWLLNILLSIINFFNDLFKTEIFHRQLQGAFYNVGDNEENDEWKIVPSEIIWTQRKGTAHSH